MILKILKISVKKIEEGKQTEYFLTKIKDKSSKYIFVEWNIILDDKYIYFSGKDVTYDLKMKKELYYSEQKLIKQLEFEEMISKISANFLSEDGKDLDSKINYMLRKSGIFFNVDRSYLFLFENNKIEIYFEVNDTGIGMTKQEVDKIFEVFYQADNSYSKKYGGAGLGIPIAGQLIKKFQRSKIHCSYSQRVFAYCWI
ncbi:MAG: ATP-binding protein [Candidatus Muiribacteriota bacterium]